MPSTWFSLGMRCPRGIPRRCHRGTRQWGRCIGATCPGRRLLHPMLCCVSLAKNTLNSFFQSVPGRHQACFVSPVLDMEHLDCSSSLIFGMLPRYHCIHVRRPSSVGGRGHVTRPATREVRFEASFRPLQI